MTIHSFDIEHVEELAAASRSAGWDVHYTQLEPGRFQVNGVRSPHSLMRPEVAVYYRDQPAAGHTAMSIGLPEYRDESVERLGTMLLLPFKTNPSAETTPAAPQSGGQV